MKNNILSILLTVLRNKIIVFIKFVKIREEINIAAHNVLKVSVIYFSLIEIQPVIYYILCCNYMQFRVKMKKIILYIYSIIQSYITFLLFLEVF